MIDNIAKGNLSILVHVKSHVEQNKLIAFMKIAREQKLSWG